MRPTVLYGICLPFDVDGQTLESILKSTLINLFGDFVYCSADFYAVNVLTFRNLYQEIALVFMMQLHRNRFSQGEVREVRHAQDHLDKGYSSCVAMQPLN
jgi:hypothetical protein